MTYETRPDPTQCWQCGYSRSGISDETPCPECGVAPPHPVTLKSHGGSVGASLMLSAASILLLLLFPIGHAPWWGPGMALVCAALGVGLAIFALSRLPRPVVTSRARKFALVALWLALIFSIVALSAVVYALLRTR